MALKSRTVFVCANCAFTSPRWQGRCPECGEWNTFSEQQTSKINSKSERVVPTLLSEVSTENLQRFSSGMDELDVVLGGGFVPGSLVLLGGDPGIGKSTLALQVALHAHKHGKRVVYISGEESAYQIKLRAGRLSAHADVPVVPETNLESVVEMLEQQKPDLAVIDSVQTLHSELVNGVVGGVSQIAFATNQLLRLSKTHHITTVIIGHVTKEGMLAGPKTLEHMVDTVLYLEGERFTSLRVLRGSKNRFGNTGEVGVFEMAESGLVEVANPSMVFLEQRTKAFSGSCTAAILEGNKVLMLEVQALTTKTNFGYPRRAVSGFDVNRLQLLLAILQKRLKVDVSSQDVYINVTGGFDLDERAADLPVVLAILSSLKDVVIPHSLAAFGEIGLSGEVRGVQQAEKRLREAAKLGFTRVICGGKQTNVIKKIEIIPVTEISQVQTFLK